MHDWFSHGKNEAENPWVVPLGRRRPVAASTRCRSSGRGPTRAPIRPARRRSSPTTRTGGTARRSTAAIRRSPQALRSGEHGKLRIDEHGLPPQDLEAHVDLTGVAGNFWVGLALLHSLFMREHNAICDHLHEEHPELSDDELYDKARLVNAALMAKIHTVEWTPAIIAHPTTVTALRANWWGLAGERLDKLLRPAHDERGDQRHPRLADEPPRRSVLADRGVRRPSTACTR